MKTNQPAALHCGAVLKKYRTLAHMSQAELGRRMQVSRNTVINWETGAYQPDLATIRRLCQILAIPLPEFFALPNASGLTEDELEFLRAYRGLSPRGKTCARELLDGLGRVERREQCEQIRSAFFPIREYPTAPAAGAGTPFNTLAPTLRFVRRSSANARADAMVRVDGQSMEPFYHSGDFVYFRYARSADPGDIVICSTADGAVIKAVDKNRRLYSLNRALPYGDKSEDDCVVVQGKVLGIVQPEDLPTAAEQSLIADVFAEEIRAFAREA